MMIMTDDQVSALRDLMREHDAERVIPVYLPHTTMLVTLFRDDETEAVCRGTITAGGHVRTEVLVPA